MKEEKVERKASKHKHYSETFKRSIIEEYLATGISKQKLQFKYGIRAKSAIHKWMKRLGYTATDEKSIKLELINDPILAKQPTLKSTSTLELEAKIKLLERQLEDERLRSEMLNRMVDLAEKTYKIPVRKNSGTK